MKKPSYDEDRLIKLPARVLSVNHLPMFENVTV